MTNSKISNTFRLKTLSALIGVALASGMYGRPANAACNPNVADTCVVNAGDTLEEPVSEMPATITNNGTVVFNQDEGATYNGQISGSGSVVQKGNGHITLFNENNTYAGGTTIQNGSLDIAHDGALGAATGNVALDGGTLGLIDAVTSDRNVSITAANGTIVVVQATTGTLNGVISGEGALTVSGDLDGDISGLILTGNNTYEGGTTIQNGVSLAITDDHQLGAATGNVTINNARLSLNGNVTSDRSITLAGDNGTLSTALGTTSTLNGKMTGSARLVVQGPGRVILTNNNDYQGGTTITYGATVSIGSDEALGAEAGSITLEGGILDLTSDVTSGRAINIVGGTTGTIATGSGTTSTINGNITDNGGGAFITTGSGTLVLAGDNTYTGGTTIAGSTLQLGDGGTTGSIIGNVVNGGILAFNRSDTVTFGGTISGNGIVVQQGAGTTALTANNTYTGGTMIKAGTLVISDDSALGDTAGLVELAGGTLLLNTSVNVAHNIDISADTGTIAGVEGTVSHISGTIAGVGGLTLDGMAENGRSGTWILTADNTYEGGTTIASGTLRIGDGGTTGSIQGDVKTANHSTLAFNRRDTVTFTGDISGDGEVMQLGTGTTILTGESAYRGGTVIEAGTLQIGDGNTSGSIVGDVTNKGALAFDRSDIVTFSGSISDAGTVIQQGTGTTILTGSNTYTGGTKIVSGTLQLGDGGKTGSIVGGVTNDGTLVFNRSDAVMFGGEISGSGAVLQQGVGTTTLTGNNTYTGGTTIQNGTLNLGNGGTTGGIQGDVLNNGTLAFNRRDTVSFKGTISGSGSVLQQGRGTTILNADNPYQGLTTINAGTLIVGDTAQANAALSGGGGVQVNAAGTLGGYGRVTGSVTNLGTIAVANATSALTGNGNFTIAGDLTNSGRIQIGGKGVGNSLTVAGNYAGNGGVIAMNAYLHGDDSASDQLIIQTGSTSGSTGLNINNVDGMGGYTTGSGIRVVLAEKGGLTSAGNFSLNTPVVAGPYEYSLYRGSVDQSSPDSWYLRSTLPDSPSTPGGSAGIPNYRPEVSLYGSLAPTALEYGRSLIDSLHERVGEHAPWQANDGSALSMSRDRLWGRYIGSSGTRAGSDNGIYGDYGPRYDYEFNGMQIGGDLWRHQGENGHRDMAGLTAAMGEASTTVEHHDGQNAGKGQIKGYSLGAYWTHYGPRDWYLDTGLMFTKYRLSGDSHRGLPEMKTDGWGMSANIETGYPFRLNDEWQLEPQAQLTYQWIDIDTTHDSGATIRFNDVQSLVGRLGVRLARNWTLDSGAHPRYFSVWGRLSVLHEVLGNPTTEFSSSAGYVPFHSDIRASWTQILFGVTGAASDNLAIYASGGYQETFTGADASGWNGKVGLRWQW